MNKKVIRILIAVCLILATTTSTAFAETRTFTRTVRYYILNNGHYDYIVKKNRTGKKGELVTAKVNYAFVSGRKKQTIHITSVDTTITGDNASKFYCETKRFSPRNMHLILENDDREIGYITVRFTDTARFKQSYHNYLGPRV